MQFNGILLQDTSCPRNDVIENAKFTKYNGVHRFVSFSLDMEKYKNVVLENKKLVDRIRWSNLEDFKMTQYMLDNRLIPVNEFIHSFALTKEYLQCCNKYNVPSRVLLVESDFPCEQWKGPLPNMNFIGYEVLEFPLDRCCIWDLLNTEFFMEHHNNLNSDGLFDNYNDAVAFKKHYIELLQKGLVGDGDVDLYVCRIYEVPNEYFIKS